MKQRVILAILLPIVLTGCAIGEPEETRYNVSPYDIRGEIYVSEVHWAGTVDNTGAKNNPDDDFIEIYNNSSAPYDISGWCLVFSGTTSQLIVFPSNTVIPSGRYYTVGNSTNGAFNNLDLVIPGFSIPSSRFMIQVQDAGGRTADSVDFMQKDYLPAGAALPRIRRSAIRKTDFFGGEEGSSYDSWGEYLGHETAWAMQYIRGNYQGAVFCSPGNR